ncbi:CPBP family intramembrane glutamic endopeptidase [Promicromonospora panici]|uniref:CPBP family intramembrane glutamic endopeptidase n=1 Tax=Promicromonospora panici TaxID=2219658 RepID=UPI00101DCE9D|nr:type II CAAX endopeptidase family protein [Promicromonospora panici]
MTDATTPDAAQPPAMPPPPVPPSAVPAPGPREYPQALRGPKHRWWRPLIGLVAMTGAVIVLVGALLLYAIGYMVAQTLGAELPNPTAVPNSWFVSPVGMLVTNLGLALGIPLALVAVWAQAGRAGLVSSVLGRVRWRLLLGAIGLSLLLLVPLTLGSDLLVTQLGLAPEGSDASGTGAGTEESGWWPLTPASGWAVLAIVILLTTPLQAAGEEYFFRGWLSQWIGSMLRWRWLALIVPAAVSALLFAFAHGAQSPWLFADRLVFGLIASLLVWRTGGLELAVGLHAANNLFAFGLAIAYDGLEESLLITEVAPIEGAVSISVTIVTTAVLLWWARRRRLAVVVPDPVAPVPAGPVPTGPVPGEPGRGEGETTA